MALSSPQITLSQILCALADGAGTLSMASLLGYTSSALLSMEKDPELDISEEQGSWIGAIVPGMALIGSLLAGPMLEYFGRSKTLRMISLPTASAWLFVVYSRFPAHVIAARFIGGFCLGIQQVAISVFVSETVHPKLRPIFSIIPAFSAMTGFLAMNVIGTMTDWRGMAWFGFIACLPIFLLFIYLPETPYFLLKCGKKRKSLNTLKWLRSKDSDAQFEYRELEETLSAAKLKIKISDMMKPPYRWSFFMAMLLHIFQQSTGISSITSFMGTIFEKSGSTIDPSTSSIVITTINIISIAFVGKCMGKYPRKHFINISSILIIFSLLTLSYYVYDIENKGFLCSSPYSLNYIPLISLTIYTLGFSIGWGPIPWMFIGDGLPLKIRGSAAGLVIATNWAFNFLTTKTFSWAIILLGNPSVYLLYALLTVFGMIIMKNIPETFGFSDVQLEKYYKDSYNKKNL